MAVVERTFNSSGKVAEEGREGQIEETNSMSEPYLSPEKRATSETVSSLNADFPEERNEIEERALFLKLETLQNENQHLKDRLLRSLADIENMQRRKERELVEARTYGAMKFARDMLEFSDNVHRARKSIPEEEQKNAQGSWSALLTGLELMERNFLTNLARHNVHKIEPLGEKFDPNLHEALFEVPASVPAGTIVQVVECGFSMGERVLRPAKVGVASGVASYTSSVTRDTPDLQNAYDEGNSTSE